MLDRIVYMVGAHDSDGWGMVGVYSNRDKAIDACDDRDYFMIPMILDKDIDDQTFLWYNGFQRPNFNTPKEEEEGE